MDYEKKYNEAIERAKQFMSEHPTRAEADLMVALFPELRESEDERIRKSIIHILQVGGYMSSEEKDKAFAYLEKQKEQKHPNGCFTCDEYKKGYEEGRRNGFTAGYNKAIKEVEQNVEQKPITTGTPFNPDDYEVVTEGNATYIKQKEQKTIEVDESIKRLHDNWMKLHFDDYKEQDERIREFLIDLLSHGTWKKDWPFSLAECVAWLENQKENPKSADSIPSDCISDTKCEDRWHKVGDSLPDNPREVLCKDEAGNYFIGRYYVGEGWDISNYDDEDKPHHLNPPVSKWIDFHSEKQKEQKPVEPSDEELKRHQDELYNFKVFAAKQAKEHHISFVHDFEWNNFCAELLSYFNEKQKPVEIHIDNPNIEKFDPDVKITTSDSSADRKVYCEEVRDAFESNSNINIPEKQAEWSEGDKKIINDACCWIAEYAGYLMDKNYSKASMLMSLTDKLKSLHPQQKRDSGEDYNKGYTEGYNKGYKDANESSSYHFPIMPTTPSGWGCDGTHCTNPQMDCINCPKKLTGGMFNTSSSSGDPTLKAEWKSNEGLDIDTLRDWSMRFTPDIREAIEATAYHFYNISPQPKQEWSEEDKTILEWCIADIERAKSHPSQTKPELCDIEINWLKSFRPKVIKWNNDMINTRMDIMEKLREKGDCPCGWFTYLENCGPQTKYAYWKPSEHQMNILKAVKDYVGKGSGYWGEALGSLIDDLEKLM